MGYINYIYDTGKYIADNVGTCRASQVMYTFPYLVIVSGLILRLQWDFSGKRRTQAHV